jgi:Mrp family chromosome partitioning ATPase
LLVLQAAPKSPEKQTQATSQQVLRLIEQARQQYDSTIIIAPPILVSADALCLGRLADFVLHVVRWNSTPRRAVVTALERLSSFGIRLDGVLISRVPHKEYRRLTGVDAELGKSQSKSRKLADLFFTTRDKRALSAKPSQPD